MSCWAAAAWLLMAFIAGSAAEDEVAAPAHEPPLPSASALKPGIAVAIAILTTFFCITSLLLLYARHCSASSGGGGGGVHGVRRINSGVDRSVVESLPVFRFASLRGQKEGLECAVCLSRFEPAEVLRLLPKCKHAFHVECVDTWLEAHSTCPLCRYRVDPQDLLLVVEPPEASIRRISARNSAAPESDAAFEHRRKDGLLLMGRADSKFEHRILISGAAPRERWSDVVPTSDLLCLRAVNDGRSASDMGLGDTETGALARWTAWISQPRDEWKLPD
ncbi:hypothetical protein V2J09_017735 [Rumex salicifolius]